MLDTFSEFGLTIEDYRKAGQVNSNTANYNLVPPPCVPYEVLVTWQKRPKKVKIQKGYEKSKKRHFEEQMAGLKPIPEMPPAIAENTKTISDVVPGKLVLSKKPKKKTLMNLF
jgi:hypothetical protein